MAEITQSPEATELKKYNALVRSTFSGTVLRVEYEKGDKVRDLIDLICKNWGITNRRGWFPALVITDEYGSDYGWELRLDDDIPTDVASFVQEHGNEFAWNKWDAKRKGLRSFRHYGDLIIPAELGDQATESGDREGSDMLHSDDLQIMIVVSITGG